MGSRRQILSSLAIVLAMMARYALAFQPIHFDLEHCVFNCQVAARGQLSPDGTFKASEILYGGDRWKKQAIKLDAYGPMAAAMGSGKEPIQIMIFAQVGQDGQWRPVWSSGGLVGLSGDEVYTYNWQPDPNRIDDPRTVFGRRNETRTAFEKSVTQAFAVRAQIDVIAAEKRGAHRASAFADLVIGHGSFDRGNDRYQLVIYLCGTAMSPVDPTEQAELMNRIGSARRASERSLLIALAGMVPVDRSTIAGLTPYLERDQPAAVRKQAIWTLHRINHIEATEKLLPYLDESDPELESLMSSIDLRLGQLNTRTVHALVRLAEQFIPSRRDDQFAKGEFIRVVERHPHPQLISSLYRMAWWRGPWQSDQALRVMQQITGLSWDRQQRDKWDAWWTTAEPVITANYDLSTAPGRAAWRKAYLDSDSGTRRILLQLWNYQPNIDEDELFRIASDRTNVAGVDPLMELWRTNRLSTATQQKIMTAFWKIELVEGPAWNDRAHREVSIQATPLITFPKGFEFHYRGIVALDEEPKLDDSAGAIVPEGSGPFLLGSLGCNRPGKPVAKAILHMWQTDRSTTGKDRWSVEQHFGPITLREAN